MTAEKEHVKTKTKRVSFLTDCRVFNTPGWSNVERQMFKLKKTKKTKQNKNKKEEEEEKRKEEEITEAKWRTIYLC